MARRSTAADADSIFLPTSAVVAAAVVALVAAVVAEVALAATAEVVVVVVALVATAEVVVAVVAVEAAVDSTAKLPPKTRVRLSRSKARRLPSEQALVG